VGVVNLLDQTAMGVVKSVHLESPDDHADIARFGHL
jgi:hypothetical protein